MRTLLVTGLLFLLPPPRTPLQPLTSQESPMTSAQPPLQPDAQGTFDLQMAPTGHAPDDTLQSFSLAKVFHGALEGTSTGEMLASGGPPSGNGGYVALERFQGTLAGRSGSFALMHSGVMTQGSAPQLSVTIVPGSGTGDLIGLSGTMTIAVTGGRHTYTLRYGFADKASSL